MSVEPTNIQRDIRKFSHPGLQFQPDPHADIRARLNKLSGDVHLMAWGLLALGVAIGVMALS